MSKTPTRYKSLGAQNRRSGRNAPNWAEYVRIELNNYGHVVWSHSEGVNWEGASFPVHRLLAVAEFGTEAVKDQHVHHKNEIPWDNRPENLELLTPAEHASHHNIGSGVDPVDVLLDLRAGVSVLGRPVSTTEYSNWGEWSSNLIYKHWDGIREAHDAAGIDPDTGELLESFDEFMARMGVDE